MKTALVLVDIQNDYFSGGAMELEGAQAAGEKARLLLDAAREAGVTVFHVQHVSDRPGATFFLPGTGGAEIHPLVEPAEGEGVIVKGFPNSFRATALDEELKSLGVGRVVFAGMMSHMCVDATVRAAFDLGYQCALAEDACATISLARGDLEVPAAHVHGAFMAALGAVYAVVTSAGELARSFKQCG